MSKEMLIFTTPYTVYMLYFYFILLYLTVLYVLVLVLYQSVPAAETNYFPYGDYDSSLSLSFSNLTASILESLK